MTVRQTENLVTRAAFEGSWDAIWRGWYTNQARGEFEIKIERLGKGPHVTVELSQEDFKALRDKFGPNFDVDEGASVLLGGVLAIDGRVAQDGYGHFDMVATRESAYQPIVLQAIGEDVRLAMKDSDVVACRQRLGIGRALVGENEV